jgi:hypothetical protein
MIITDRFVFIHIPKNGGSFVTSVLRRLHNRRPPERIWDRLYNRWLGGRRGSQYEERAKHAPCFKIPREYRDRTIVSPARHPFDRYVSQYFFGWWRIRSEHYCDAEKVKEKYPHFPDLSFDEFLRVSANEFGRLFNPLLPKEDGLGWYSRGVVKKFFQDPWHTFYDIDDEYIAGERWKDDMFDVRFLRTSNLNRELYDFLRKAGYATEELQFILDKGTVDPSDQAKDRGDRTVDDMFTPETKALVRHRDRLVFEMFPDFKEQYTE